MDSPEPHKPSASRKTLIAGTLVFSVAIALLLAEAGLRVVGFQFELFPKLQFGWPNPDTMEEVYQVDKQLLWVPKDYQGKVSAWKHQRPALVYMGDSCTEFGRYDQALDSLFGVNHPDRDVTWANVGVGGWSTYQGLRQFERDIVPMQPRVVTVYFGWNDHWMSFGIEDKDIGRFNLDQPALLIRLSRLRVVQLVNRVVFAVKFPASERPEHVTERVSLPDFVDNLTAMARIARENDITMVFITAPSSHREGEEPEYLERRWLENLSDLVPLHRRYVEALREVAATEDVPVIDLYAAFEPLSSEELEPLFDDDGIHLTPEGNRRVAQYVYEWLGDNGVLERVIAAD